MRAWPKVARDSLRLALWSADEIAEATGGVASGDFQCSGVEMDSRDVRPGDLFVALKGEAMDGHRFIDKAFAAGAAAAIVDRPIDWPHVLVEDTTAALHALAAAARTRGEATRIAVTGSVGKTGVKEAIFSALDRASRGQAHRSVRSYNNHVGVPLSVARMSPRARYGVFEMGMNHAGEIAPLADHVRPDVAVITTIAPAHIENLGSLEAIADEKAQIFTGLKPGGAAIIPADSEQFERLKAHAEAAGAEVFSFGRADHARVRLLDAIPAANGGASLVTAQIDDTRLCYSVAEPGEHWIANSLAVMACIYAVGGDLGAAGIALGEMGGLKGRGARHAIAAAGGRALLIDESYNANPASMRATLTQLGQTPASRRIAVLGAMGELGEFSTRFHEALLEPIEEGQVDYAVLVGDAMEPLVRKMGTAHANGLGNPPAFAHCAGPAEAIAALEEFGLNAGDAILVKGSNAVGLGRLVDHFVSRS
ncbi:UDP-N-acetylmuramoylalanyl-D-glutamyl-2, 6-diaminopimelate--D-alanyl-D-alanine ligase [Citromicrobium sp. JL31]|nr:UDP-N-acetylmuramoylalanyl-D-glutamyl-2, 6-diaminopimelate--D-alanyl-D-alanine ligase [Citromicrobium sp. JL477]KPM14726.1 UDP-N-acetylmuramoylalanyl-D-glutamyl-2, 6-diaminopimelate--D-alanyl-D-alanine ligase [Citromicrobium sp. JL1351]KPM20026.1 UDP-N-acetylmuramoylalanyl-D-glutamyl-2, 6-diaminopimelate--D-alanyl-D-alanine ligase [Citromicrobium sp. JL31]KPM22979.1 UDP-N-acetylmuramoylalanyl-D-glutamyl-2, 6-diaminopimelate--D-alanyl-D-alanine ligase [Citromicrobium sp. JL2201]